MDQRTPEHRALFFERAEVGVLGRASADQVDGRS